MPSNRDILEAQRFNRRRLVTAFTSGTPGGRELEPRSPMRPLVVGVALVAVMALVALAVGRLRTPLPDDWGNNYLLVEKGTGVNYFTDAGVLHPVTNVPSARLLATSGLKEQEVSEASLRGKPRGPRVGLTDAPSETPPRTSLQSSRLIACTRPGGIGVHTWVAQTPTGLADSSNSVVVVSSDDAGAKHESVIFGGQRHAVEQSALNALHMNGAPVPVSATWLGLFEQGDPLAIARPAGFGRPAGFTGALAHAHIGDVVQVNSTQGAEYSLVTAAGRVAPLNQVQLVLYGLSAPQAPRITADEASVAAADHDSVTAVDPQIATTMSTAQIPCARLVAAQDRLVPQLAAIPATGQKDPEAGKDLVDVAGGSGALLADADLGDAAHGVRLVTDDGRAYNLGTATGSASTPAMTTFGYQASDVAEVPSLWLKLVPSVADLTPEAARKTMHS